MKQLPNQFHITAAVLTIQMWTLFLLFLHRLVHLRRLLSVLVVLLHLTPAMQRYAFTRGPLQKCGNLPIDSQCLPTRPF